VESVQKSPEQDLVRHQIKRQGLSGHWERHWRHVNEPHATQECEIVWREQSKAAERCDSLHLTGFFAGMSLYLASYIRNCPIATKKRILSPPVQSYQKVAWLPTFTRIFESISTHVWFLGHRTKLIVKIQWKQCASFSFYMYTSWQQRKCRDSALTSVLLQSTLANAYDEIV
jgi:hypothetical protein